MKIIHASRKERAAFFAEVSEKGLPMDLRYRHWLFRLVGKRTRKQRQARLSACFRPTRRSLTAQAQWRKEVRETMEFLGMKVSR